MIVFECCETPEKTSTCFEENVRMFWAKRSNVSSQTFGCFSRGINMLFSKAAKGQFFCFSSTFVSSARFMFPLVITMSPSCSSVSLRAQPVMA